MLFEIYSLHGKVEAMQGALIDFQTPKLAIRMISCLSRPSQNCSLDLSCEHVRGDL